MFKEIFKDFIELSYYKSPKTEHVVDISVQPLVIARINDLGCTIHYLFSGSSLRIPWLWIDIFKSLNVHSGDRIICLDPIDNIDKVGILFTELCIILDKSLSRIDGDRFLEVLLEISELKTEKFRVWIKETHGINLDPLEYSSLNNNIEI